MSVEGGRLHEICILVQDIFQPRWQPLASDTKKHPSKPAQVFYISKLRKLGLPLRAMASHLTSENLAAKDGKVTNRLSCGNHGPHTPAGSMARWNVHGQHGEREKRPMLGRSTPVTSYSGPPSARIAVIYVSGSIVMVVIAASI